MLAFTLSWAVWVPVLLVAPAVGHWVAMVGAFGPAVAAALMVRRAGGSVRAWLRSIARFAVPARWYAIAVAIPVAITVAQLGLAALFGLPLALSELPLRVLTFILSGAVVLVVGGGQEEPGWRGWLQPVLQERVTPLAASAVVGVVWALWHLPLFVLGFSGYADVRFWLYVPTTIGLAIIATYLWNASRGSVIVVMVLHAAVNASGNLLPLDEPTAQRADVQIAGQALIAGAMLGIAAALVARHGAQLAGRPPLPAGIAPASPASRSRLQRAARRGGQTLAGLLALSVIGAGLVNGAERRFEAAHPPPGVQISLPDGRLLHYVVAGAEHEGPTVVLLGGAGAPVTAWGWVLPRIAEHAPVIAVDRAGLGWSDPSDAGTGADAVLADLRAGLDHSGLPGPYVLVGHSLGAHYARAFAAADPGEVAGIVLVDPSHEQQAEALGMRSAPMGPVFAAVAVAARVGLTQVYLPRAFTDELRTLPEPERGHALKVQRMPGYWRTFGPEMASLDDIGAALPTGPGALGSTPLRVLIATGGATTDAQREQVASAAALREGMVELSSDAHLAVLAEASHVTIVTEERHARVISDAIVQLVEAAR